MLIVKLRLTFAAGFQLSFPDCDACTTTVPAPEIVSVLPLIAAGPLTIVYVTVSNEFDDAAVVRSIILPGAKVVVAKPPNVIV